VFDIEKERPEYRSKKPILDQYRDLYAGGEQFMQNASLYLHARSNEPADVFGERLRRAYYENYVGSIIDWYATTLFRREPLIGVESASKKTRGFYSAFTEDCDLRGSTLSDLFRRQLVECLICGKSYLVLDFPRAQRTAGTRAEEDALGISRAYLSEFPASALTNWQRDDRGDFEWAVLRTERTVEAGGHVEQPVLERKWIHYDRTSFRMYRQEQGRGTKRPPELVDEGPHSLARLGRVPLFELAVTDGMWLMNKAASLQLEHFNKSNALSWALTMGLFAMPVIYSEREWDQVVGESYFIQLGPNDRFGWTEPEGHVYEIALKNIDRLKDEIYRVCYLLGQAGGSVTKNAALTGLSKQRDYAITQEVLRGFGDLVKDALKNILTAIATARGDEVTIGVSGLDEFDIGEFGNELSDAERLLALGIPSPTLKSQIMRRLAMKYLCDVRQEVKDRIIQEIEKGQES
jgi:hypothetical protein